MSTNDAITKTILKDFCLDSPFLKNPARGLGFTGDGKKICYSQQEKDDWDANELLDLSQLWAKYHGRFLITHIQLYLARRGLGTLDEKYAPSFPEFKWKNFQEIDWLQPHTPTPSVLWEKGQHGHTLKFRVPSRHRKDKT